MHLLTRDLQLVFLCRRWQRGNPSMPPRARRVVTHRHLQASAECCRAVGWCGPEWAGQLLVTATSQMELPPGWPESVVCGSLRSHARDQGGVTGHALRILAQVVVDHDREFGLPEKVLAAEILHARQWACCHTDFVRRILAAAQAADPDKRDNLLADAAVDMEIVEDPPVEEPAAELVAAE